MFAQEAERLRAMLVTLLDSGDITPTGVRQIDKLIAESSL